MVDSNITDEHGADESGGAAAAAVSDLSFWSTSLQAKATEAELERRVESLQQELKKVKEQLKRIRSTSGSTAVVADIATAASNDTINSISSISTHRRPSPKAALALDEHGAPLRPPEKRGYLFKWMDRSIGWGGTKWSLRFVTLQRGRLSYYATHTDTLPRYVLSLRGFDVRDDGWKRNSRHGNFSNNKKTPPPLDEPGAYFFVFSIVRRPEEDLDEEDYADLVPLLRFSTPSMTDRDLWMQLISETCAYCETDEFLLEEDQRDEEFARQQQQQANMAHLMPEAKEGTLPPLYFAPASAAALSSRHRRRSSVGKGNNNNNSNTPRGSGSSSSIRRTSSHKTLANGDVDEADARSTLGYPPSKPMHRSAAPSFLSAEASAQHFRGLFNLGVLVLVFSNVRLLLDTIRRYGLVPALLSGETADPQHPSRSLFEIKEEYKQRFHRKQPWQEFPFATGVCLQLVFLLIAYGMEYLLAHKKVNGSFGMTLHYINAHSALLIPTYIVWTSIDHPVVGAILLFHASITWMKLVSYVHANQDYRYFSFIQIADQDGNKTTTSNDSSSNNNRQKIRIARHHHHRQAQLEIENLDEHEHEITYPQNVTFGNLLYFWCAPTLTYQIAFPKYPVVRWWKVIGIILRLTVVAVLITFLAAQVMSPTLQDLVKDLEGTGPNGTWLEKFHVFTEYWIKLSIASTYMWLLIFYGYFHLYLNLFAELLRFGDRVFYKDWWNSSEASAFWRLWNVPVHYWLIRHVYFPCIRLKISRNTATFLVFSLSAIMHEVLVSVPFHIIRPWSFLGMMMQMPLVAITKQLYRKYPGSSVGNMIFWISFCVVGQPMAVLLYTVDYQFHQHHQHSTSQLNDGLLVNGECQSDVQQSLQQCLNGN